MSKESKAPSRELLLAHHAFPGEFIIKAFGPAQSDFRDRVEGTAREVMGSAFTLSERSSRGGRSICVTLVLKVRVVDEVVAVYDGLYRLETLKYIL